MKKTALAAAVAISLGTSAIAQANTAGLTGVWTGTYSFAMTSPGSAPVGGSSGEAWTWDFDAGTINITNTAAFYGSVWTASGVTFGDNGSSYGPAGGAGTQNMTFAWSVNPAIPVTSDWDVTASGTTAVVTVNAATILPTASAFPGFHPAFSGNLTQQAAVPVPAAAWLMGSGLMGLVGVARRRKKA